MAPLPESPDFIGQSAAFQTALGHASAAAALDRPLLICGERGSGKELFAGRIHFLSPRWDGPFVKVNCAALSDDLLDSELFGHEAGAFTGAQKRHIGRFERADGGTLFLDEIPSASLRVQEKLLRVIEYGEFERLGGETTVKTDVRIVAAANVDLPALAARGDFRADLLDRLAFDVIYAPPLRERREDIPLLAAHFGAQMAREMGETFDGFTADGMALFLSHDWPGNVRELKNAAERSVFRWFATDHHGPVDHISLSAFADVSLPSHLADAPARDDIAQTKTDQQIPAPLIEPSAGPRTGSSIGPRLTGDGIDLRAALDRWECEAARQALALSGGNQKDAAARLNLTYNQMRGIVRKYRLV